MSAGERSVTNEEIVVRLGAVLVLGVGAQWLAWRFRLPSILLLLGLGFVAGPATGFLKPDDLFGHLLAPLVSLSVAVILFEGGLNLRFSDLPQGGGVVRNLVTIGVVVTWAIAALFAHYVMGLEAEIAALLGAVVVVTGPTVIGPLLEQLRPVKSVSGVLRWEGIIIDPVGAILAVLVFEATLAGGAQEAVTQSVIDVMRTVGAGAGLGLAGAGLIVLALRRYLVPDTLQNPVSLMIVVSVTTAANWVQSEAGLLAATLMGIALANQRSVSVRHILEFKESLRVLLIGSLFIVLASRLEVDDLTSLRAADYALLAVLVLVARPLAVALSTARSPLTWRERAFLAWMAPRGIIAASVASIFALRLAEEGAANAEELVSLTFMVVIGTIAIYGLTASWVARRLDLARPNPQGVLIVGAHPWARAIAEALQSEGFAVLLVDSNRPNVAEARLAGLDASYANILAEESMDGLDLDSVGRLLALTSNDEVNALAAQRFAERFGRARVFQLALKSELPTGQTETIPRHLHGRFLFNEEATFQYMEERFAAGATVKATNLSDEFDYDAYVQTHGRDALPLFVIPAPEQLSIVLAASEPAPKPGQRIIALVSTEEPAADEREAQPATPAAQRA